MLIKDMVNTNASAKSDLMLRGDVKIKLHNTKSGNTEFIEGHNTFMSDALNVLVRENGINSYGAGSPLFDSMRQLLLFHEQINDGDYHLPLYAKPYGMADDGTGNTATDMGSLNPNEVESGFGFYKSVYDFSTSQCNGELNSIGYYYQTNRFIRRQLSYSNNVDFHPAGLMNGREYYVKNNKLTENLIPHNEPLFMTGTRDDFDARYSDQFLKNSDGTADSFSRYLEDFTIGSDGKSYSYYIRSDKKLREMIFDPATLELKVNDFDVAGIDYPNITRFCTADTDIKYIYCLVDGKDADHRTIYKIDRSTMAVVNSKVSPFYWGWAHARYYNGAILLINDNGTMSYYIDAETLEQFHTTWNILSDVVAAGLGANRNISTAMITDRDQIYTMLDGRYVYYPTLYDVRGYRSVYPLMLTSFNLESTITKTASQTMKITYTLTEES